MVKTLPDVEEVNVISRRQRCGVIAVKALCIALSPHLLIAPVLSLDVGVQVGDRARWTVRTDWSSETASATPPSIVEFMQGVEIVEAYVRWVGRSILTHDLTARSSNGAARTPQLRMDLSSGMLVGSVSQLSRAGIPGLGAYFVPSGLRIGDSFSIWWRGQPRALVVDGLESRRYAGATRQIIEASHTVSLRNSTEILAGKWDRSTGMLCEATLIVSDSTSTLEASIHILETNRWGLVEGSAWTITLALLIIALAASVLIARRWFLRRRKQDVR